MGACRRDVAAGTVTHSVIERTASWVAIPPSRNARVDEGTSAAAISWDRVTSCRASCAARLA